MTHRYPFSAIVGQPDLRLALLLNAIAPEIGGVLIRGEKGTAKSTAVRGLASLLGDIEVVAGCPYACDPRAPDPGCPTGPHDADTPRERRPVPFVELPVGATADRVSGSIDLERALREGRRAFEPGLLAAAHRGIVYVDEVNLLPDHVVDLLLDAAALGTNYVEREGVSVRHASRFLLVGTMNPEEGELRPQLLDRFGITAEVRGSAAVAERAEVVRRRLVYEAQPEEFARRWGAQDGALARRIGDARERLRGVRLPDELLEKISEVCTAFGVHGLRGDIVTAKTATALAAWEGRTMVGAEDIRRAALLALPHRRRRGPLEEPGIDPGELERILEGDGPPEPEPPPGHRGRQSRVPNGGAEHDGGEPAGAADRQPAGARTEGSAAPEQTQSPTAPFSPVLVGVRGRGAGPTGRRSTAASERGRVAGEASPGLRSREISAWGTVRAAAPHQIGRGRVAGPLHIAASDVRYTLCEGREGNLVLFVVDASGSMAARKRMAAAKGAILSLLVDAYQRRDRVAMIAFRGEDARVLLPPTTSVELAAQRLAELPTGGRTPLHAGLDAAREVVLAQRIRDPLRRPFAVVVTDGRPTAGRPDPLAACLRAATLLAATAPGIVVDTEHGTGLGMASELARVMRAPLVSLEELEAGALAGVVRLFAGARTGRVA